MQRHTVLETSPATGSTPPLYGVRALLATQFLSALNDNLYKMVVSLVAMHQALKAGEGSGMLALVSAVFIVPFLLFSGYAGRAADVFSKRTIIVVSKMAEVLIMGLAWAAFHAGRLDVMLGVLFALATQATFFGPAKYGLLPELLPTRELVRANGLLEMSTFLAILLGTALGSGMFVLWQARLEMVGLILLALAIVGTGVSFWVPSVAPAGRHATLSLNPWGEIIHGLRRLHSERPLWLTVLGIAVFWLIAALLQMAVLMFGKENMGLDDLRVGLLGTCLALGIGAGSLTAGRLSGHKVELGLVPLGAIGMGLCMLLLSATTGSYPWAALALTLLGVSGGWFIVPLQALLQQKSPHGERGLFLATNNFLSMGAILGASGLFWLGREVCHLSADRIILLTGVGTLGGTIYVLRLLPGFFVRLVCWMLTQTLYRIRVVGGEHIPREGPALLVCNHISYVDGLLISACVPRFVRFLMYRPIYEAKAFHWLFRLMQVIPIADGPGASEALARARQALTQGHVVCIFAEGAISRTGNLLPFKRGLEKVGHGLEVPVLPVHLDRLWGSIFSFQGGRFLWKWPKYWPYAVTVSFGAPLPATVTARELRQVIVELGSAAMVYRQQRRDSLSYRFLRTARRRWSTLCMAEETGVVLTYGQTLVRSLLLARWIRLHLAPAACIGIDLPTSVQAGLANLAVMLAGKVPVNLDAQADTAALQVTLQQCAIRTLVTARSGCEAASRTGEVERVCLEAVMAQCSWLQRAWVTLLARCLPTGVLHRLWARDSQSTESLATVVFSRGRTGTPSGIMLSHGNILANIEGLQQVFALHPQDRIVGVLSLSHALGCTVTLWLPLITGCGVMYHHSALEAQAVAALMQRYRATILVGTPLLYSTYLQSMPATAFATMRYAVSGAEALPARVAQAFKAQTGLDILEGYGCAEMAAVVSVNTGDVQHGSHRQTGSKPGSVGHPVPGVAVKIIHPTTGETLPPNTPGLLLVRGPYPMLGYLGQPHRTAAVLHQGWYSTDDLASVDEDGFVYLHGRLPGAGLPGVA